MNLVDVFVSKVIKPPYQVVTYDVCCYEAIVETDCYGRRQNKTVRAITRQEIEKYTVGFSWKE
jgi:hypothetical protein